jgi:hypothetical protein
MEQEPPAVKLYRRLAAMTRTRIQLAESLRSGIDVGGNFRMYADSVRKCRQAVQEMVATFHDN